MKDKENSLTNAYDRANDYAHRIMDAIRREHKKELMRDPELRKFEDFDYNEGIKQFREMALHHINKSSHDEIRLDDMTSDEFIDKLLERRGVQEMTSAGKNRSHTPK